MTTLEVILLCVLANWAGMILISWVYLGWLWKVSGDVKFEGWVFWRGWLPIARFRLISTKSWYAKLWNKWYGFSFGFTMIHRDVKGTRDDLWVEKTIVHEARHAFQQLALGMIQWLAYALDNLRIRIFTKLDPYKDNWFECDARRAADKWEAAGRPRIYSFGERR